MIVYLVNESTVVSDALAQYIAECLNYQALYHYGRSGWRSDVRCKWLSGGGSAQIPSGGSVLHLLDTSDQQGALGYHDEDGNEVPFARVFCKDTLAAGDQVSECASHELLELATDPHVNDCCLTGDGKQLWAKEVGDPCQGNGYDVGILTNTPTGIIVADFVLPNFFDPNTKSDVATDFRGALKGPFALGPQGYYSYIDMANASAGWQQKVGSERKTPPTPDLDDRVGRR
jgi:hypothetical protein